MDLLERLYQKIDFFNLLTGYGEIFFFVFSPIILFIIPFLEKERYKKTFQTILVKIKKQNPIFSDPIFIRKYYELYINSDKVNETLIFLEPNDARRQDKNFQNFLYFDMLLEKEIVKNIKSPSERIEVKEKIINNLIKHFKNKN